MYSLLSSPDVWVLLASGMYIFGYLIIHQVSLRLMTLLGSIFYVVYYAIVDEAPLWGAIYGSLLMITTNLIGLAALYFRNAQLSLPRGSVDLYPLFAPIQPGDFRALMRLGERVTIKQEQMISREGEEIDKLYFITRGTAQVIKRKTAFPVPGPIFVGEVAYLLESTSAATTIVPAETEMIIWDVPALRKAIKRKPRLKLALDAVISKDLATKVTYGVAPVDLGGFQMPEGPANTPAPQVQSA